MARSWRLRFSRVFINKSKPLGMDASLFSILYSTLVTFCLVALLSVRFYDNQRFSEVTESETHSTAQIQLYIKPNRILKSNHATALTVNFPLRLFGTDNPADWRTRAVHSTQIAYAQDKKWKEYSRAQDAEDAWLYEHWFYGMTHGVILESGALDGIRFSTSYMFEHFANWTSLHVEADLINYGNLIQNRADSININCALCSEPQLLHYADEGDPAIRGFVELMPPAFLSYWNPKISSGEIKLEDLPAVQCVTAKSLLRELHVHHIDIWVLDVEGAEESVLKGTDFSKVRINAIAMECDTHDIPKNKRKTDIIESHGFECTLVQRNCMCRNLLHKTSAAPQ